ncbi:MAG: HYR domain-containing protein, partial [Deltaproteobacteria bacterium]
MTLVALPSPAQAQRSRHYDVWNFGSHCRVVWNASATAFTFTTDPSIATGEGCTSFSDPETGQLLIYSDGITVWNGSGTSVFTGLPGDPSSLHSGVIVPVPGSPGQVYVFGHSWGSTSTAAYRKFALNAGAVTSVGTTGTVSLGSGAGREGMLVVQHTNGVDWWLLIDGASSIFVVPITAAGVGAPISTPSGLSVWSNGWSVFTASHDGRTVVMSGNSSNATNNTAGDMAAWDFDPATGTLSNRRLLNASFRHPQYYGGVFSPNGRRLYFSTLTETDNTGRFWQYDFDSGVFTQLAVDGHYSFGDGRLAPDGRIFVAGSQSTALHVINAPDEAGTACNFVHDAYPQPAGCQVTLGLPQSPSALAKVNLDLAVTINAPTGLVLGPDVTPAGSAQAPDGATVSVTVVGTGGAGTCTGTVSGALWTCSTPIAGLTPGWYLANAELTYSDQDPVYDSSPFHLVACLDDGDGVDAGCSEMAPYCASIGGERTCVPCLDDSATGTDTGCDDSAPACDVFTGTCGACADDGGCAPQVECQAAPDLPTSVPADSGCLDDNATDLFVAERYDCWDGCDGDLYFEIAVAVGNRGAGATAPATASLHTGSPTGPTIETRSVAPLATGEVREVAFFPSHAELGAEPLYVVVTADAAECDTDNNTKLIGFAPAWADIDQNQLPDLCQDCVPTGDEVCDGVDNDCDESTDEGCDDDGDGWCDDLLGCVADAELLLDTCEHGCGDCDDDNSTVNPGGVEVCNGVDDDCGDGTDEDLPTFPTTCGVGACFNAGVLACVEGAMVDDCAPLDPLSETDTTCDGVDDNCNEMIDEGYVGTATSCPQCQSAGASYCAEGSVVVPDCAPIDDGTVCDGGPCALAAACDVGQCKPTLVRSCNDDNPCTADRCDALEGCMNTAVEDGTACEDGNLCTGGDTCSDGVCGGTEGDCAPPAECELPGTCNPATGLCDYAHVEGCTVCGGDAVPPTITCPAAVTGVECVAGGVTVELGEPTTRDVCSGVTVMSDAPPTYGLGVTTVTFTGMDAAGNAASCGTTVEVIDTTPPTLSCPERTEVEGDPGICGATVTVPVSATDGCDGSEVTVIAPEGAFFPPGPTTVQVTAVDAAGNQASCTTVVDVVGLDTFAIACPDDLTVDAPATACGYPEALTATVHSECDAQIEVSSDLTGYPIGESVVSFHATSGEREASCETQLTVRDVTPPIVTCPSPAAKLDLMASFAPQAEDACGVDLEITSAVCVRTVDGVDTAVAERCDVEISDGVVLVRDAPPSEDGDVSVRFVVVATDPSGNATETECRGPVDPESLDHDHDTVPDRVDNCPTIPNSRQGDVDLDGIGDICDDTPTDGLLANGGGGCAGGGVSSQMSPMPSR